MAFLSNLFLNVSVKIWLTVLLPISCTIYWILWCIYARTLHPLASIPGPVWPSISRLCLVYHAYTGDLEIWQLALHERYGPLVRVAPDEIVCDDPREISTLYPIARPLEKTVWFDAWRPKNLLGRKDMYVF
jgi:hypothetical protein